MKRNLKELLSLKLIVVLGLVCLTLILIAKTPVSESFWLDESITVWLTTLDLSSLIYTSVSLQAQSPLGFVLFWVWSKLFGSSEIALRALSILASLITLTCSGRLGIWFYRHFMVDEAARKTSHEVASKSQQELSWSNSYLLPAALLPPLFLLSNENFLRLAWTARPYALGLAAFAGSLVLLVRWCSSKRVIDLISSITLLLLAFYLHYLLLLGALIHLLITLQMVKARFSAKALLSLGVIISVAMAPGIYHLYCWSKYRDVWSFLPSLTLSSAALAFLPRQWFVYLCVSLTLTIIASFPRNPFKRINNLAPVAYWVLFPSVALIILSILMHQSLLSNRYLLTRELGLAILAMGVVTSISTNQAQRLFLSVWLILCCGFELNRQWRIENWRQVALHLEGLPIDMPVLLNSGLAELKSSAWIESVKDVSYVDSYLSSPLKGYNVSQKIYPIAPSRNELSGGSPTMSSINPYQPHRVIAQICQTMKSTAHKDLILVTNMQSKVSGADETQLLLKQLESLGFVPTIESDLDLIRIYSLKKL